MTQVAVNAFKDDFSLNARSSRYLNIDVTDNVFLVDWVPDNLTDDVGDLLYIPETTTGVGTILLSAFKDDFQLSSE